MPRDISSFELQAFFTFSRTERELIGARRGDSLKLGSALHIGFLRMSGRVLDAFRVLPPALWRPLGNGLGVDAPEIALLCALYGRGVLIETLFPRKGYRRNGCVPFMLLRANKPERDTDPFLQSGEHHCVRRCRGRDRQAHEEFVTPEFSLKQALAGDRIGSALARCLRARHEAVRRLFQVSVDLCEHPPVHGVRWPAGEVGSYLS